MVFETEAVAVWPTLNPQTWQGRDYLESEPPIAISIDPRDEVMRTFGGSADSLDRIPRLDSGKRRAALGGGGNGPRDQVGARERARRIVNHNHVALRCDDAKRVRDRILAPGDL